MGKLSFRLDQIQRRADELRTVGREPSQSEQDQLSEAGIVIVSGTLSEVKKQTPEALENSRIHEEKLSALVC